MKLDTIIAEFNSPSAILEREMFEDNGNKGQRNQANGIAFERKQHKREKKLGVLSVLSAGSLGLVDIVTLRPTHVLCISCKKNGYVEPKERKAYDKLKMEIAKKIKYPVVLQLRYKKGHKTFTTTW